jgi:putative transcriptional regulator
MNKKLSGKNLKDYEAGRNIWQEVTDGIREIKSGGGRRISVEPKTDAAKARLRAGMSQVQFAKLLGVSKRTLEQWEQGRRQPSGAAKSLIRIAEIHPEVLKEIPI